MIITICGSSRFKDQILEAAHQLTLANHIVLVPFVFYYDEAQQLEPELLIKLSNLQKERINMSDAIFVVNINGYIGESTYGDIDWAYRMKKQVFFLNNPQPEENNEVEKDEHNDS